MASQVEIPIAKVLKPSLAEFTDFEAFVEGCDRDKTLQTYGMVKVVPPAKWKARTRAVEDAFGDILVSSPIEQNVQGRSGIYELLLIQKKSMKLNDYRKKIECFDHLTDYKTIEEVETMFWKSIAFSPPLYGADISGRTLFDPGTPWNLSELPGLLRQGLKSHIAGVTTTYLYIGAWKSMFGWHKEDMDLYSINYNHHGKPKFWYCMPVSESKKLEEFAQHYFGDGFSKCKEFLRHKTIMIHPYLLKQKIPSLKIYKMIQYPGEFIITGGGAYHAGFNWGFNIAEAVNFATVKWMEMLPYADACRCVSDSVKINKAEFFKNILAHPKYGAIHEIKQICADHGVVKSGEVPEKQGEKVGNGENKERVRRLRRRSSSIKLEETKEQDRKISKKSRASKSRAYSRKGSIKGVTGKNKNAKESTSHLLPQSKKIKRSDIEDIHIKKSITKEKGRIEPHGVCLTCSQAERTRNWRNEINGQKRHAGYKESANKLEHKNNIQSDRKEEKNIDDLQEDREITLSSQRNIEDNKEETEIQEGNKIVMNNNTFGAKKLDVEMSE